MNMHSYLEIVSEQIRCRRAKQMILEELEGHIEDQKLDYMADGTLMRRKRRLCARWEIRWRQGWSWTGYTGPGWTGNWWR